MGLFGKLFEKKICDVCGEEIGLFGNRKLEDGNLCKDCAKKLSPFFNERRESTVEEIKEQLAYREENKKKVEAFNPTKVIGGEMTLYFDEDQRQWLATRMRAWRDVNPDVIEYSQVLGCDLDIDQDRTELKREDAEGNEVSYNPPRYEYSYDFFMTIHINSPWFDSIRFKINDEDIHQRNGVEYMEAQRKANEIKDTFTKVHEEERAAVAEAAAPKQPKVCPFCGATTMPDAKGCCEYCGSPLGGN